MCGHYTPGSQRLWKEDTKGLRGALQPHSRNFSQHAKGKMTLTLSGALGAPKGCNHTPGSLGTTPGQFGLLGTIPGELQGPEMLLLWVRHSERPELWWELVAGSSLAFCVAWVRVTFIICPFPSPTSSWERPGAPLCLAMQ